MEEPQGVVRQVEKAEDMSPELSASAAKVEQQDPFLAVESSATWAVLFWAGRGGLFEYCGEAASLFSRFPGQFLD